MKRQKYIIVKGYEEFQDILAHWMELGWVMVIGTETHDYKIYDRCGLFSCVLETDEPSNTDDGIK